MESCAAFCHFSIVGARLVGLRYVRMERQDGDVAWMMGGTKVGHSTCSRSSSIAGSSFSSRGVWEDEAGLVLPGVGDWAGATAQRWWARSLPCHTNQTGSVGRHGGKARRGRGTLAWHIPARQLSLGAVPQGLLDLRQRTVQGPYKVRESDGGHGRNWVGRGQGLKVGSGWVVERKQMHDVWTYVTP